MKRVIISTKSFSDSNAHKQVIIYLNLSSHHMLGCRPMERTNGSYTILYLIAIIISVFTLNRCWSYVGRTGRKQQLSLAGGCWRHGTVAHEIGEFFVSFLRQVSKILLLNHSLNPLLHSNNLHSSRSSASCSISLQLVEPRSFRSA